MKVSKHTTTGNHHGTRFLKLLARHRKNGLRFSSSDGKTVLHTAGRDYTFADELVEGFRARNCLLKTGDQLNILPRGLNELRRLLQPEMTEHLCSQIPDRHIVSSEISQEGTRQQVARNINESPLSRLFHRKNHSGGAYISAAQFEAGERIRRDFEKGQLQPKVSASLDASVGATARGNSCSAADISDFAIDARRRVSNAVDALGPELSGVILDVCCFLKGLEAVEREKSWPPRSAKLMLRTGLSVLARHYGFEVPAKNRSNTIRHWGSDGFRPELSNT